MVTKRQPTRQRASIHQHECLLDQIRTMRVQESTTYRISTDYLSDSTEEGYVVSTSTRQQIFSWALNVAHACNVELPSELAITSITCLDRFLSNCDDDTLDTVLCSEYVFQLCSVACFAIALKNFARMNIDLYYVSDDICHGNYTAGDIAQMELKVLQGLNWCLNGPTAMDFVHAFLQLIPPQNGSIVELFTEEIRGLVEKAMISYPVALEEPSSIAYASILVALDSFKRKHVGALMQSSDELEWIKSIASATGIKADDCTLRFIQGALSREIQLLNAAAEVPFSDASLNPSEISEL